MMMASHEQEMKRLEAVAAELLETFKVVSPPIPVESMLQHPLDGMWEEVDPTQLSGTFINIRQQFSPRMSLARLLARHVIVSPWGKQRELMPVLKNDQLLRAFARMLVMPGTMVMSLSSGARNPTSMSMHFEVPDEDARQRLQELALYY